MGGGLQGESSFKRRGMGCREGREGEAGKSAILLEPRFSGSRSGKSVPN